MLFTTKLHWMQCACTPQLLPPLWGIGVKCNARGLRRQRVNRAGNKVFHALPVAREIDVERTTRMRWIRAKLQKRADVLRSKCFMEENHSPKRSVDSFIKRPHRYFLRSIKRIRVLYSGRKLFRHLFSLQFIQKSQNSLRPLQWIRVYRYLVAPRINIVRSRAGRPANCSGHFNPCNT